MDHLTVILASSSAHLRFIPPMSARKARSLDGVLNTLSQTQLKRLSFNRSAKHIKLVLWDIALQAHIEHLLGHLAVSFLPTLDRYDIVVGRRVRSLSPTVNRTKKKRKTNERPDDPLVSGIVVFQRLRSVYLD